jgi:lipopolysaccharide export system protein LptA
MKRFTPFLLSALLLGGAGPASAEKADALKPIKIDCDECDANGITGIYTMLGKVVITRGTLKIEADRGRIEETPEGYSRAILEANPGRKVRFRQKGDGPGQQWMEGEAERVDYDERSGLVKLFSKARVQRTVDGRPSDEAEGAFISYDSHQELFSVRNTTAGEDVPGAGRGTIIIQPKRRPPAPSIATTEKP